jgi:hypothetical protein
MLLFAGVLGKQLSPSERSTYGTEALEVARRLTIVLDRDLAKVRFAGTRNLQAHFLRMLSDLYDQATEPSRLVARQLLLKHPSGQQIDAASTQTIHRRAIQSPPHFWLRSWMAHSLNSEYRTFQPPL